MTKLFNSYVFMFTFLPVTLAGFFPLGTRSREWALDWLPEIEAADGRRFNLSELLLYGTQACRGHWSPIRGIKVDSPRAGLAEDDEL